MTEPTKEDYAQYMKLMSQSIMNIVMMADKIGDKGTMGILAGIGIILTLGEEEDNIKIIEVLKPIIDRIQEKFTNEHGDLRDILERLD